MNKILIIDDDKSLLELLQNCMQSLYEVDTAWSGKQGLDKLSQTKYALVLLDVMLPGENGFEVLERIRKQYAVPVIMLTAKNSPSDKVSGLETGADDYVTKPFNMEELLARAASQIRRNTILKNGILPQEKLCFEKITVVPQMKGILKENKEVLLTGKEFDLLYFLASSPMRAYTKKQIYKAVWKDDYVYDDNNIMALVSKIRKKIEDDPENPKIIQTVRGVGYRFWGGQ
ncbi:MAG: response regulator transcription factor [Lachnospiraceae bacterium]|nr:response regulator transcription factor [Lachnospiraceae bacterium]